MLNRIFAALVNASSEGTLTGLEFNPMNFVKNLEYMGMGMLGIFIVIGVIILIITLFNKITSPKKNKEDSES